VHLQGIAWLALSALAATWLESLRGVAARKRRLDRERVRLARPFVRRITERHYKPWVKTLQKKLEDEVRKAWS
jgi:hypothetical protein